MNSSASSDAHSLKLKLLLPLLLIGVVLAAATIWGIYAHFQQQFAEDLRHRAELIAVAVNSAAESISRPSELQRIVTAIGAEEEVSLIVVAGGRPTRVLASTRIASLGKALTELPVKEVSVDLGKAIQTRMTYYHFDLESTHFDFTSPILLSQPGLADQSLTDGAVMIHLDFSAQLAEMRQLIIEFSCIFLSVLALFAALGYGLFHYLVLRPVSRIGRLVEQHQAGVGVNWAEVATNDELGALARTLDGALTRTDKVLHQLQESEEKFRTIFENAGDAIILIQDDRFVACNDRALKMFGYRSYDQLMGYTPYDLSPPLQPNGRDSREIAIEKITATLAGQPQFFEWMHKRLDGTLFPVEVSLNAVNLGGEVLLQAIIRDISERKQAEDALRAAEEQFRSLVEQAIAGICIVQDGKFAYVNPRFVEIVGHGTADELIGSDALLCATEADRSKVAENMCRLLNGEAQSIVFDFGVLRSDAVMIQVGANIARASHEGRPAIIGMLQDISEKKRANEEIMRYIEQLKSAFMSTVQVATLISEMRDPYTAGHERRVAEIAVAIGAELGLDVHRLEGLRVAGCLHDIGKITIPAEILSKPGKLTKVEYLLIQGHAQASYDVLKGVEFPWLVAQVVLQHHERMDGSGYPQGIKSEAILFEARILAVADVVEAMSSHRPYRAAFAIDKALAEIEGGRGTLYDADVADACLRLFREQHYQIPA